MKIFLNICMTIIIGTACGCSNFLNEQVKAGYPDDAFYKTAAQAELAVNAAYQPLSFSNDQNRLWVFGDVASDDADKGGNPGDQADIGNIDDFVQIYPINGNIESVWGIYYEGITRCNKILQQVPPFQWIKCCKTGYWVRRISCGLTIIFIWSTFSGRYH
jgi:hypothetical protein